MKHIHKQIIIILLHINVIQINHNVHQLDMENSKHLDVYPLIHNKMI